MKKDIKVLLLEDNFADADLIVRQLKKSEIKFSSKIVETRKSFEESLETFSPDIILSDYSLPSFDAVSAFKIVREKKPGIPFIIISGTIGEENAVMLIKDGVTDFASKNNLPALPQKFLRALKEADESKEKKEILEKLKTQTAALLTANKELVFQNDEKEKRAVELLNANRELLAFNFISNHDLQEPLRKIQMFTSMMDTERKSLSELGNRNLNGINNAATRMRRLIEDLLLFSSVSSSEHNYEIADLYLILEDVKSDLKDLILEKKATIVANNLFPVSIVVFQFRQLIHNLISNALKFSMPHLPPVIVIESKIIRHNDVKIALPQKCDYWNLTFTDNGIGFETKYNEYIFQLFKRLHSIEKDPGTGIGLAIVKKIIDNHNGIIVANSEINKGTTFEIYIPIHKNTEMDQIKIDSESAMVQN